MAYKIRYSPQDDRRYPTAKRKLSICWKRWLVAAMILSGVIWLRQKGIPDFLIPGDEQITRAAAKTMLDNLQQGIPVSDAVTVFCREILDGAGF